MLGVITNSRQIRSDESDSDSYNYGGVYGYGRYNSRGVQDAYVNDPLMAYSYYEDEPPTPKSKINTKKGKLQTLLPTPKNLQKRARRIGNRINQWLEK
jgi:hypothetical protein